MVVPLTEMWRGDFVPSCALAMKYSDAGEEVGGRVRTLRARRKVVSSSARFGMEWPDSV